MAEFATKTISSKFQGFTWTVANKTPAYESVRAGIFDHKIKFKRDFQQMIVQDFQNVHRIVSEAGKVSFQAGRGVNGHSDITSAIVLGHQAIKTHPVNLSLPQPYILASRF